MSNFRRAVLIALAASLSLMLIAVSGMAQGGGARVRFVHAIPGASAVDIYADGQLTIKNLGFGQATNYVDVAAGAHHLSVNGAGSDSLIWEQDISPSANTAQTLIASSAAAASFTVFQDDLNALPFGKARFTALHAIADGPSVDVLLSDGRPVIPGLVYDQPYGTLDLPAAPYELGIVPTGEPLSDALVAAQPYALASGTSYVLLAYGTTTSPQTMLLRAATLPQEAGGYLRIAHALPDAEAVDVYVNNTLAVPSLAFGSATVFMALPAGTYTVSARPTGATDDLASGEVDLAADAYATALITGNTEAPAVESFDDPVSAVSEATAVLSVINSAADVTVSAVNDGSPLLSDIASGNSDATLVPPTDEVVVVSTSGAADGSAELSGGIYGGVYYTAVAVNGGEVILLPPVGLAQGIGSAPGAQPAETPTVAPTVAPTEAAQPTTIPAEPTQAATQPGAETAAQPTTAAVTTGPTARVLTNPGVNLQLRQYPNRESLSLGLAPSGTVLRVNGRAGAPVPPPDQTATPLPPAATEFVDLATVLEPGTDLDPNETWINVTFDTPDGGTITAWVNALYLGVRDSQGRAQALRNLPTVPGNQAGVAQNTSVQPPEAQRPVTLVIAAGVDPGVNMHIRRTPDTAGESLALIPAGTQLEFVGVNEAEDWVFVRLVSPDSTVSGWLSIQFVTLQRNGQSVDFERLQLLNELRIIPDDQRGSVVTSGQPTEGVADDLRNVVAGQVTGLNPGANLHLRRNPNNQAESLALLPNGTNMVVNARTLDDAWLSVTYQGQPGWVASAYIQLSFNGQPYELAELPVVDLSIPEATEAAEATETPQG